MFTRGFEKTASAASMMPKPPRMNSGIGASARLLGSSQRKPSPPRSTKPGGVRQSRAYNVTSQLGGVTATNG